MNKAAAWEYSVAFLFATAVTFNVYVAQSVLTGDSGLTVLNVALAVSTFFLLGFVLLLGPMSRLFDFMDQEFRYRKEIGIMSFFTGVIHVYLSMFVLARRGPFGLFESRPFSAYPGIIALILLFMLLVASLSWAVRKLGSRNWWRFQYWGARAAFLLIVLHMVVLKQRTITSVFTGSHEGIVPLIMYEIVFAGFVVLVRLSEFAGKKIGRSVVLITSLTAVFLVSWLVFS